MKRTIIILIIGLFLTTFTKLLFSQAGRMLKTVVIDAGHGGRDPGALGKNSREKNINLTIALKLGKLIEKSMKDVRVIYTRKTDVLIPLHKRTKIANDNQADFFISIHCNSNTSSKIYGAETYVMGLHKSQANLEVAKLENSSILKEDNDTDYYEGFNPNSAEAYIIFSLYQNTFFDYSLDLAARVQKQFKTITALRDRGVLQAGFLVLYRATMPGILIETGYLSNSKDEKYLLSDKGQTNIATSIYNALKEYKLTHEKLDGITSQDDKKYINALSITNTVIFRVQFLSSGDKIKINSKRFRGLKNIFEYEQNGVYKYCSGESAEFDEMNSLKSKLQKGKFNDAFVVAFKNGQRITVSKARNLTEK